MKYIFILVSFPFLFFSCEDDTVDEALENDTTNIKSSISDENIVQEEFDTILNESYNDPEPEEEATAENYGMVEALFKSADMVEGEVGLHFIDHMSGRDLDFYYFDIDPVKEGLYTVEEVEGSVFPELVTNPDIEDVPLTLYWQIERRHIDLADEDADVKVLKKIER